MHDVLKDSKPLEDDWGLGDFAVDPHTSTQPKALKMNESHASLLEAFEDDGPILGSFGETNPSPGTHTSHKTNDDDDILGLLGQPVDAIPKQTASPKQVRAFLFIPCSFK